MLEKQFLKGFHASKGPFIMMNQMKSIYNSPLKQLAFTPHWDLFSDNC